MEKENSGTLNEAQGDLDAASLPSGGNWRLHNPGSEPELQIALEERAGGSHWLKKE
jgi:hypothetical protein